VERKTRPLWRHVIAVGVISAIFAILAWGCDGAPRSATSPLPAYSPLQATVTDSDEVPDAAGYFMFWMQESWVPVTSTLAITQELRLDGDVLAVRTTSAPLAMSYVVTDAVMPHQHLLLPWSISPVEGMREWTQATLQVHEPYTTTIAGVWYTDLHTPAEPNEDGMYLVRKIEVHKLFLPVVGQGTD
jgi:hypothetical protein